MFGHALVNSREIRRPKVSNWSGKKAGDQRPILQALATLVKENQFELKAKMFFEIPILIVWRDTQLDLANFSRQLLQIAVQNLGTLKTANFFNEIRQNQQTGQDSWT